MKIINYWRLLIWFAIMCYLLFMPANQLPSEPFLKIPHFDKMVHFGMFFILCLFLFRPVKSLTPNYYFWAPIAALSLAVLLEFLQQKITVSRSSDIYDFWANAAGLSSAVVFYRLFINNKKMEILF